MKKFLLEIPNKFLGGLRPNETSIHSLQSCATSRSYRSKMPSVSSNYTKNYVKKRTAGKTQFAEQKMGKYIRKKVQCMSIGFWIVASFVSLSCSLGLDEKNKNFCEPTGKWKSSWRPSAIRPNVRGDFEKKELLCIPSEIHSIVYIAIDDFKKNYRAHLKNSHLFIKGLDHLVEFEFELNETKTVLYEFDLRDPQTFHRRELKKEIRRQKLSPVPESDKFALCDFFKMKDGFEVHLETDVLTSLTLALEDFEKIRGQRERCGDIYQREDFKIIIAKKHKAPPMIVVQFLYEYEKKKNGRLLFFYDGMEPVYQFFSPFNVVSNKWLY